MKNPPNLSNDAKGYNSKMFKSDRAVRRGFRLLGYGVSGRETKVPSGTVRQFQKDYNKCAKKFGRWGAVKVTGKLNKDTLNGLEHAIRWAKKHENTQGTPAARMWQSLCGDRGVSCDDVKKARSYSRTEEPVNFVEVMPDGNGKLRNIRSDHSLRCTIEGFERHGNVIFAVVKVPPQDALPGGRPDPIICPCVISR